MPENTNTQCYVIGIGFVPHRWRRYGTGTGESYTACAYCLEIKKVPDA